jgi:hypothetical protein
MFPPCGELPGAEAVYRGAGQRLLGLTERSADRAGRFAADGMDALNGWVTTATNIVVGVCPM